MSDDQPFRLTASMLRAMTDFSPYIPNDHAPAWLQILGRIAQYDAGTLALAGPSGLSLGDAGISRSRTVLDAPSMFVAGLVDRLRGTEKHLAIGIPPAARHLPLLVAGSTVLASVVDRNSSARPRGDGSVLIVSPDLEARSRYCDLRVGDEFVDEAYPGSRMRPDGQRVMLEPKYHTLDSPGVCFFLPGLALPSHIKIRPTLILIDMRYSRWVKRASDLAAWASKAAEHAGIVLLYTIGDTDTLRAVTAHGYQDFPLDHGAVATCLQYVPPMPSTRKPAEIDWSLASAPDYLDRDHEIIHVNDSGEVEAVIRDIDRLLYQNRQIDTPELRRVRWLVATLGHLPVPLVTYEYSARAMGRLQLKRMIDQLGAASRNADSIAALVKRLKELCARLYDALWRTNPREVTLRARLPEIVASAEGEQTLVLLRDRITARAFQDWVALEAFPDEDWISRLEIQALPTYFSSATHRFKQVVVNSALSRRYSWVLGAALGAHVTYFAYTHEVAIIKRQLEAIYGSQELEARAQTRFETAAQFDGGHAWAGGREGSIPPLRLVIPESAAPSPETHSAGGEERPRDKSRVRPQATLTDLSQLASAFQQQNQNQNEAAAAMRSQGADWVEQGDEEDLLESDVANDSAQPASGQHGIKCLRAVVNSRANGHGVVWLECRHPTELFRHSSADALQDVEPEKIRVGDVLILTHDTERMSLFDRIVQLAEGQPRLQHLAVRRRAWQDAVRRMAAIYRYSNDVDYETLLRALQRAGATIVSTQAVRSWVEGYVIGPENIKSITAVGHVSHTDMLVRSARVFDTTFHEIRGIRQGIGRQLSYAIRRSFRNLNLGREEHTESHLDNRLGIAVDELLDAVDFAEVVSIDAAVQWVAPHRVGRFLRE